MLDLIFDVAKAAGINVQNHSPLHPIAGSSMERRAVDSDGGYFDSSIQVNDNAAKGLHYADKTLMADHDTACIKANDITASVPNEDVSNSMSIGDGVSVSEPEDDILDDDSSDLPSDYDMTSDDGAFNFEPASKGFSTIEKTDELYKFVLRLRENQEFQEGFWTQIATEVKEKFNIEQRSQLLGRVYYKELHPSWYTKAVHHFIKCRKKEFDTQQKGWAETRKQVEKEFGMKCDMKCLSSWFNKRRRKCEGSSEYSGILHKHVVKLRQKGDTWLQIAQQVNKGLDKQWTHGSLRTQFNKHNEISWFTEKKYELVTRLLQEEKSWPQIARLLMDDFGEKLAPSAAEKKYDASREHQVIIELRRNGYTWPKIVEELKTKRTPKTLQAQYNQRESSSSWYTDEMHTYIKQEDQEPKEWSDIVARFNEKFHKDVRLGALRRAYHSKCPKRYTDRMHGFIKKRREEKTTSWDQIMVDFNEAFDEKRTKDWLRYTYQERLRIADHLSQKHYG